MSRSRWSAMQLGLAGVLALVAIAAVLAVWPASPGLTKSTSEGYLGVNLQDLDEELRSSYGLRGTDGVLISEVAAESPAEKAGLRRGDILVRVGGTGVESSEDVIERVRGMAPGDIAILQVWRDNREETVRVTLGERPNAPRAVVGDPDWDEGSDGDDVQVFRWKGDGDWDEMDFEDFEDLESLGDLKHLGPSFSMFMGGRGRLGVRTQDVEGQLGSYFQAPDGKGVLVVEVIDDTPAAKAGLAAGDLIVGVEGKAVESSRELRRELSDREPGPVRVDILRRGSRSTLTAQLEERKETGVYSFKNVPRAYRHSVPPGREMYFAPQARRETAREMERLRQELRELEREMQELRREMNEDE